MSQDRRNRIELPPGLRAQLTSFRRALLLRVSRDALMRFIVSVLAALLLLMVSDRWGDTPQLLRGLLLLLVAITGGYGLWSLIAAGRSCRSALETAKMIRRCDPVFGDHLVGAIELAWSETEQARSKALCQGALNQVAEDASNRDLGEDLPPSHWRSLLSSVAVMVALVAAVGAFSPALLGNVVQRLFQPYRDVSRFTFVDLDDLPERLVVPRDQESTWVCSLPEGSRWKPASATLTVGARVIQADLASEGQYVFQIPGLIDFEVATVHVGDASAAFQLVPQLRPQLTSILARILPPAYVQAANLAASPGLGRDDTETPTQERELTQGLLEVVRDSRVTLRLSMSRDLSKILINGREQLVDGSEVTFEVSDMADTLEIDWVDRDGLNAETPVTLTVKWLADQSPVLFAAGPPVPERVLDSQALKFNLTVRDDLAVRRVGMQWESGDQSGEQVLGPRGEPYAVDQAELIAVFQASTVEAPAGDVRLRFWAEDDFPGRGRIYADPIPLSVLTADEHAVWIASQFARWQQTAMDVRDQELSLFERNRELAQASGDQRDQAWQDQVRRQAEAEAANARQLRALTNQGQALLVEAARNDEVAVGYVEKLAETIQTLQTLAEKKMPRIASLLKEASEDSAFDETVDVESTQGQLPSGKGGESDPVGVAEETAEDESGERLGLAGTTIVDTSARKTKSGDQPPGESLALAVEDQTELVAAFDSVADELRAILGNMEGSTLVKRLKSVSRLQDRVATHLGRGIEETFGEPRADNQGRVVLALTDAEESVKRIRTVLDDMDAFLKRREVKSFADVQTEMKQSAVLEQLGMLRDGVADQPGISIAVAEYWADTFDRWADDLIEPGSESGEQGSKRQKSVPPEIILEVLRVLDGEVQLRERTRVADQGRLAMTADQYMGEAIGLSEQQDLLRDRLDVAIDKLVALPDSKVHFESEMQVLGAASTAMADATETLVQPETGAPAIAAQTEAIELLLRSQKVSPEGGGGGGGNAGASSGGDDAQPALAMVGRGIGALAKDRQSDIKMSIGRRRTQVPEQWRSNLQRYYDQLELKQMQRGGEAGP